MDGIANMFYPHVIAKLYYLLEVYDSITTFKYHVLTCIDTPMCDMWSMMPVHSLDASTFGIYLVKINYIHHCNIHVVIYEIDFYITYGYTIDILDYMYGMCIMLPMLQINKSRSKE